METQAVKRPNWMTVLAILGIAFGLLGMLGSLQNIIAPKMLEFQQKMLRTFSELGEKNGERPPQELLDTFETMFDIPEWFGTWLIISGIIGALIMGYYVYASITLLNSKPNSLCAYMRAMWLSIAVTVLEVAVGLAAGTLIGLGFVIGGLISIIVDVVLLVVALSNRDEFRQYMAQLYPQEANPYISSQG